MEVGRACSEQVLNCYELICGENWPFSTLAGYKLGRKRRIETGLGSFERAKLPLPLCEKSWRYLFLIAKYDDLKTVNFMLLQPSHCFRGVPTRSLDVSPNHDIELNATTA